MEISVKRIMIVLAVFIFPFSFEATASAVLFDEVVVFGDSLSDNGNLVFIENQPKPDQTLYYEGRFSNGPVWVEYLTDAQHLNVPLTDKALGGAQTNGLVPPGLIEQVIAYVTTNDSPPSANALFAIWIGGNDFLNANGDAPVSVDNINDAMQRLAQFGVMNLLVLNLPDLGQIPAELGSSEAPQATAFTNDFNSGLANMLDEFRAEHPGIMVFEFDVFTFAKTVRNDPTAYGFVNVTEPSPNFDVPDNFDGAGYLFWDERHPTTGMHALIADQVFALLNQQAQPPAMDNSSSDDGGSSSCFIRTSIW